MLEVGLSLDIEIEFQPGEGILSRRNQVSREAWRQEATRQFRK